MRSILVLLSVASLGGCATPAPQSGPAAPVVAPFNVPMDPGQIRCSDLFNPNALAAASEWTLGQLRASAMAGRIDGGFNSNTVSNDLALYCRAHSGEDLRTASRQLGGILN